MIIESPNISVVISTYNRPKSLSRLLNNLANQICIDLYKLEVCVIDDGSGPNSMWFPSYPFKFDYVYRERHPDDTSRLYSNRNLAVSRTTQPWILQLDDDLEVEPFLIVLLQSLACVLDEWGKPVVFTARISNNLDIDEEARDYSRGLDGRWWRGKISMQQTHWQSTCSAGMFMPRSLWNRVGGYDEAFDGCMGFADQELALRCQKAGAEIWLGPYFVNIDDGETGSHRMIMIDRRKRSEDNWDLLCHKHPDAEEWTKL